MDDWDGVNASSVVTKLNDPNRALGIASRYRYRVNGRHLIPIPHTRELASTLLMAIHDMAINRSRFTFPSW
jgi:hypothetical protein